MKTKLFYKQMTRSVKTVAVNVVILTVVTAFFCMSLNLYSSSMQNLMQSEDTYSTIAVMELYGDVNEYGELTERSDEDYAGYLPVSVEGYDFYDILNCDGVLGYDLRIRCAAYIEDHPATIDDDGMNAFMTNETVIRFTLSRDEEVRIPISWSEDYTAYRSQNINPIYLKDIVSAVDFLWYNKEQFMSKGIYISPSSNKYNQEQRTYYAEQVKKLNRSDETDYVVLYPGVEYIASIYIDEGWKVREDSNGLMTGNQRFDPGYITYFGDNFRVVYGRNVEELSETVGYKAEQPFPIARWEDVQNDTTLKEQWEGAWEAANYNLCTYNVCLTKDITGVPAFHLGGAFLADGRMITKAEYEQGAKVCMVSKQLAQQQHWYVGDKLNMDFYHFEAFANTNEAVQQSYPIYHKNTEGFFDSGEFEIVGIFDQKTIVGNSGISQSTIAMPWNQIYIPHNAVQNTLLETELPVHGALLTIWLENGSVDAFLRDVDTLGITQKTNDFTPTFSFYDQGYSLIQPSLQSMYGTAKLLLVLSASLLLVTCTLLAYFFAQNQKHNIGILRMLGGKKKQAIAAVLACVLVLTLLGAIPGAILGHGLTKRVGDTMLNGTKEDEKLANLKAYVLTETEKATMELVVEAEPATTFAATLGTLLFPLLVVLFILCYINKEPRELLPKSKL